MRRNKGCNSTSDICARPGIESSGSTVAISSLAAITVVRAIRYPLATLAGAGSALVAHDAIINWGPSAAGLLVTSVFGLFAGIALFLVLTSLMVLDKNRLDQLGQLFRTGALVSILATSAAAIPVLIGLAVVPLDWQTTPQWQPIVDWWPAASIGFGVAALGCVFPAFLIAWPTSAHTGLTLLESISFVWRDVEDSSYSPAKMSLFVGFVGWVLVSLPGTGLLAPILFAHLSAALLERLVIVGEQ